MSTVAIEVVVGEETDLTAVPDFVRPADARGELSLEIEEWLYVKTGDVWAVLSSPLEVNLFNARSSGPRRSGFLVILEWFSQPPAARRDACPAFRNIGLVAMSPAGEGDVPAEGRACALAVARAWAALQARQLPACGAYGFRPARRDFLPQGAA